MDINNIPVPEPWNSIIIGILLYLVIAGVFGNICLFCKFSEDERRQKKEDEDQRFKQLLKDCKQQVLSAVEDAKKEEMYD